MGLIKTITAPDKVANPADWSGRLQNMQAQFWNWIEANGLNLLIALCIAAALFLVLTIIVRLNKRAAVKLADRGMIAAIVPAALGRTTLLFRAAASAEIAMQFIGALPPASGIVRFIFTIAVVVQCALWVREIIIALIERRARSNGEAELLSNAMVLIRLLISTVIFAIAAIVILDNLGVNVTGLVAGLGVGGIAIGLAAQGIFSDLFAAIAIIFDRPFKVGDSIRFGTNIAEVEQVGVKSTRLRSVGGELLVVANHKLLEMEITNYTQTGYRRTRYPIALVNQTSPEKAAALPAILKTIVEENGGEFVRAGFIGFGASSIDFDLFFDIHSQDYQVIFETRHRIGIAIIAAFGAAGYEFAYPTQTTFTAAPDGTMVLPYASPNLPPAAKHRKT
jgi:small-conductance mechanosensitive channel